MKLIMKLPLLVLSLLFGLAAARQPLPVSNVTNPSFNVSAEKHWGSVNQTGGLDSVIFDEPLVLLYYVDSSCSGEKDLTPFLTEMFSFACAAVQSLMPAHVDADYAYVFQRLFNVPVDDTRQVFEKPPGYVERFGSYPVSAKKTVLEHLITLCKSWQKTTDLEAAVFRLYCDEGAHFSQALNPPQGRKDRFDPVNGIIGTYPCDGETEAAVTSYRAQGEAWDKQNQDRATLTLCQWLWDGLADGTFYNKGPDTDFSHYDLGDGDTGRVCTEDLRPLAGTLLHEWLHSYPYLLDDAQHLAPEYDSAYAWEYLVEKPTQLALSNAETYHYLGVFAWLARQKRPHAQTPGLLSGGYTLERPPTSRDPASLEAHEEAIKRGDINFYHDITTPSNPGRRNP